jgi:CRISPR-associated protein Csd2
MTLSKRYDFVLLFDVKDGNPNGDPDAGNLPRTDPETGHGLVTDVCLKRKLRNYVLQARSGKPGFDIFVKEKAVLNRLIEKAHEDPAVQKAEKKDKDEAARVVMCRTYYDVRTFGAVMTTGEKNAGQVRGPVQLTFSRSVDPVLALEHSITRMAVTNERDAEKERTMGRKATLPYALYRAHGFVNPNLAAQTGFSQEDLDLFWEGLAQMFEHDRSAARGMMTARKLVVFEHASTLGNASAASLFDRLAATRKDGVEVARSYQDYQVALDKAELPEGITIHERF